MTDRPYSPATLAKRWQCSAQLVRNMLERGDLSGFRHGKMWRIPAAEVARYEGEPASPPEAPEQAPKPAAPPWSQEPARPSYGWPQAMKRKTAAAYCEISIAAFEAAIAKGQLPTPFTLGGRDHWHKPALDKGLERLAGGDWTPIPEYRRDFYIRLGMSEEEATEKARRRQPARTAP